MIIQFPINICGQLFTYTDLEITREILRKHPAETRVGISRLVCQKFEWYSPNGRLKEMSCRVALLKLHRADLIRLPPPRRSNGNGRKLKHITSISDPGQPILKPASQLGPLHIEPVLSTKDSQLWNQLVERYHYLGYKPLPGAQMRYFIRCSLGLLAVIGFSASAWKVAPRDQWIGWNDLQREKHLHLVINNSRFLILPWVQSQHLASKILALCAKHLPSHWLSQYGYKPILIETFVQKDKFRGTCYRAANWIYVGQTKGRGKKDSLHLHLLPIKDIWLYPLNHNFRGILCQL